MSNPNGLGTWFTIDGMDWTSHGLDASGASWQMETLTGWDDPVDTRAGYVDRAASDGSFDAAVFASRRSVTWTGLVVAPDIATREACKATLAAVARVLQAGADLIGHDDDGVPKTVHANRDAGWKIATLSPNAIEYQIAVVCPDPYKYGPTVTVETSLPGDGSGGLVWPLWWPDGMLDWGDPGLAGQLTLSNPGTEDAWPLFTVTGPVLGGLSITDVATGRRIVYPGDVPDGAVMVIDSAAGTATLNGAARSLPVAQWWPVPPAGASMAPGVPLEDVFLVDEGTGRVGLVSPDLVAVTGAALVLSAAADLPSSAVQFSTSGPSGQAGFLSATVAPTYQ